MIRLLTLALALPLVAAASDLSLDGATAEQLASLDHVDTDFAEKIVALRTERGGHLSSVEQLRVLPGADEEALSSLRRGTTVTIEVPLETGKSYDSPDQVLAEFDGEPTIQQVQDWANQYAQTSPDTVRKLLKASKSFAALPQLTTRWRMRDDWDQDFIYLTADGGEPIPGDSPEAVLDDAGRGQYQQFDVQARWELGELIMSSERIRMVSETQDIVKLRDKMLTEVTQLYFDRRRHQVNMMLSPAVSLRDKVDDEIKLLELTAGIDALTGGRFSQALSGSGG